MNKKSLLLLLFIVPISQWAQSQDETKFPKNRIGVQVGLNNLLFKDLVFSPLNYNGQGISGTVFYQRIIKRRNLLTSSVNFSSTIIAAGDISGTRTVNQKFSVELNYLYCLTSIKNRFNFYTGGRLSSHIDNTSFEDGDAITYFNFHGLSLAGRFDYHLNDRHQLISTMKIPIWGNLVRPVQTGWDNEFFEESGLATLYNGEFVFIGNFFRIEWANFYQYKLSKKIDLTFQIDIQYFQTSKPALVKMMKTQVSIGSNLKF